MDQYVNHNSSCQQHVQFWQVLLSEGSLWPGIPTLLCKLCSAFVATNNKIQFLFYEKKNVFFFNWFMQVTMLKWLRVLLLFADVHVSFYEEK